MYCQLVILSRVFRIVNRREREYFVRESSGIPVLLESINRAESPAIKNALDVMVE